MNTLILPVYVFKRGHAVAQVVDALRQKPEGLGFKSLWCHELFIDIIHPAAIWLWGDSATNRKA